MATPRSPHYATVLRILRYLKGTIFYGLHFSSHSSISDSCDAGVGSKREDQLSPSSGKRQKTSASH